MLKIITLASIIVTAAAAPALAEPIRGQATQIAVPARGVDFANAKDVRDLHEVLSRTSVAVCDSHMPRQLAAQMSDRRCARDSMDRAVATLHQPLLTAYHDGHAIASQEQRLALSTR